MKISDRELINKLFCLVGHLFEKVTGEEVKIVLRDETEENYTTFRPAMNCDILIGKGPHSVINYNKVQE